MSKNARKNYLDALEAIRSEKKRLQKQEKKFLVECTHQNQKGEPKLEALNDKGLVRCKFCGTKFNVSQISENELRDAVAVIHDAVHQIKAFADPVKDVKFLKVISELDYNAEEFLPELYDRMININAGTKKGKKKKRKEDTFGSYGQGGLSFIKRR